MQHLEIQGLAETNGKHGRGSIWHLTPAGVKALSEGSELPPQPRAGPWARGIRAGFGPHGIAVTETILACGGRHHLTSRPGQWTPWWAPRWSVRQGRRRVLSETRSAHIRTPCRTRSPEAAPGLSSSRRIPRPGGCLCAARPATR
ncbi:replication-relaxation family protein [Streptomyces rimosus]|uniref:replication-relaxation family protein n=1 Tax=Streptomyces rimosus TaxID=1927 RepID=UPI00099C0CAE